MEILSFFSMERKNDSKSVSIAIFGALTEKDIDIIHQFGFYGNSCFFK